MKALTAIQKIFVLSLLAKLILAAVIPLFPDEAYYWVWSHHLQWSYFDHPPMVAWWFWLGHPFEGMASLVRWPAVLLAHLSGVFWFLSLKPILNKDSFFWWALFFAFSPLTGPGLILVTPDLPLMFFWALGVYLLTCFMATENLFLVLLLGFVAGLGFCSKYHMVLFPIMAGAWLIFEKRDLQKIISWSLLFLPAFLLGSFPVWWWNMHHDWVSFLFQLRHGGLDQHSTWEPEWTLSYLGGELLLIFPTVFWAWMRQPITRKNVGLWIFAVGPLLFFALTSFKGRAELNWPIVAMPAVLALAAESKTISRWGRWTIFVWALAVAVLVSDIFIPWIPVNDRHMKTREPYKFQKLAAAVVNVEPLFARSYQMAGALSFQLQRQIYKLQGMNRMDFYDLRPESQPPPGQKFYLMALIGEALPAQWRNTFEVAKKMPLDSNYELLEVRPR